MHETARRAADDLITLEQVALMARVDRQVVLDAVRDRKLVAQQVRGDWQVKVGDVRKWLARR